MLKPFLSANIFAGGKMLFAFRFRPKAGRSSLRLPDLALLVRGAFFGAASTQRTHADDALRHRDLPYGQYEQVRPAVTLSIARGACKRR